ncbi:MAG: hypothetical protein J0I06_14085 [Planctomycetes bacterium]|nr:hypothetical protein [Planctomycetota bacterium]
MERLTLGEEGRGYGGKWRWPEQSHRTVDRLELPKVAPAREPESPFPKPGPRVRTYRVVDLVLGKE